MLILARDIYYFAMLEVPNGPKNRLLISGLLDRLSVDVRCQTP
jgi:hypothetical protein